MFLKDFIFELKSISEVSSIVGDNVYPVVSRNKNLPCIVYNISGQINVNDSVRNLQEVYIDIEIYAKEYELEVDPLITSILNKFNNFTGVWNPQDESGGTMVSRCAIENTRQAGDQVDPNVYRVIVELEVYY